MRGWMFGLQAAFAYRIHWHWKLEEPNLQRIHRVCSNIPGSVLYQRPPIATRNQSISKSLEKPEICTTPGLCVMKSRSCSSASWNRLPPTVQASWWVFITFWNWEQHGATTERGLVISCDNDSWIFMITYHDVSPVFSSVFGDTHHWVGSTAHSQLAPLEAKSSGHHPEHPVPTKTA